MIPRTEISTFLAIDRGKLSPLVLKHGETVNVNVLDKFPSGSAKIGIRGFIFTATVPKNIKKGTVAKMIVSLTQDKLFLTPLLHQNTKSNFTSNTFLQVGIPRTPVFEALLTFFKELGLKIDIPRLKKLAKSANRISRDSKKTAFLAAMLDEKGIIIDDNAFHKLYDIIFLNDKNDNHKNQHKNQEKMDQTIPLDENTDDLLKTINHIHGGNFHWIIVPFEKKLTNVVTKGSCAILLNLNEENVQKVTLRASIKETYWTFVLENNICQFEVQSNKKIPSKKILEKILLEEFNKRNIEINVVYGIHDQPLTSVDISI